MSDEPSPTPEILAHAIIGQMVHDFPHLKANDQVLKAIAFMVEMLAFMTQSATAANQQPESDRVATNGEIADAIRRAPRNPSWDVR